MISYVIGDLFESPAQTLVNTVNTVGVMGKGIALGFKKRYPAMFAEYKKLCEDDRLKVGTLYLYRTPQKLILNFPTKENWRRPSRIEWIAQGLRTFVDVYRDAGIHSVAFPPLGCGNGELKYEDVRRLMEDFLGSLPIPVYLYPPRPATELAEHRALSATNKWLAARPVELSFNHVWENDMREVLLTHRTFARLDNGLPFTARWMTVAAGNVLEIGTRKRTIVLSADSAKYFWRELVANPVLTSRTFPADESPFLFALFAQLPYVRSFPIADTFEDLQAGSGWGLQLVVQLDGESLGRAVAGV